MKFEVGSKYERIAHGWKRQTDFGTVYHHDLDQPMAVDPHCVLQGQIDSARKEIAAQACTIAGMAAKIEAQQDQLNRHATQIGNQREKIETHSKQITEHDQALLKAQCNGHEYLSDRLDALERIVGSFRADQLQFNQWLAYAAGKPITENWRDELKARAKPTIKGGWANVYRRDHEGNGRWMSKPYSDRAKADREAMTDRIACIQIPDITEGEGL